MGRRMWTGVGISELKPPARRYVSICRRYRRKMKRTLTIISAALMGAALSLPMIAQASPTYYPPVHTGYGEHHPYVEGFDSNYLDSHPDVRAELARNPRLIDDPA